MTLEENRMLPPVHTATRAEITSKGSGIPVEWGIATSSFGNILLARTHKGISHLAFFDTDPAIHREQLLADWAQADFTRSDKAAANLCREMFHPTRTDTAPPPLHLTGTPFQNKVWRQLLLIPAGNLTHYSEIAVALHIKNSARAVGNAVGRNKISYLVPCHRVIRKSGSPGGYRWGTSRKLALISWERATHGPTPQT